MSLSLSPNTEPLKVGDAAPPDPRPAPPPRPVRVPFGSYLDPDLQRRFKAQCVMDGIEMQDGLEEAVQLWLASRNSS